MRIHNTVAIPSTNYSRSGSRAAPVMSSLVVFTGLAALMLFMGFNYYSVGAGDAEAGGSAKPKISAIVAKHLIPAGKIIDRSDLDFQDRVESELPDGAVSDTELLIGRAASSPIPARSAISDVWLVDDDNAPLSPLGTIGKLLTAPESAAAAEVEPVSDEALPVPDKQPAAPDKTSRIFLKVRGQLPAAGSRVAIGIEGKKGKSAVVLAETVVQAVSGSQIELRVSPLEKEYLKSAQQLGKVRLIALGDQADENPFSDIAVSDIVQLKKRLSLQDLPAEKKAAAVKNG